jgi:hypothetical protein
MTKARHPIQQAKAEASDCGNSSSGRAQPSSGSNHAIRTLRCRSKSRECEERNAHGNAGPIETLEGLFRSIWRGHRFDLVPFAIKAFLTIERARSLEPQPSPSVLSQLLHRECERARKSRHACTILHIPPQLPECPASACLFRCPLRSDALAGRVASSHKGRRS